LNQITWLLFDMFPLFVLFFIFMIGWTLAYRDFKPKSVHDDERFIFAPQPALEPIQNRKSREYSNRELGIDDLDNMASMPHEYQRYHKMQQKIRNFSTDSPDAAANVIKACLHDRT